MTDSKSNPTITRVQLSLLRIGKRHRAVDKHKVASFAKSMAAIGLQTPISVYDDGTAVHLVAGLHRVKAAMSLGWEHIDGIVVELDEVDREIWEIDENLMRAGLSKAEEREHFKRRKELWRSGPKIIVAQLRRNPPAGQKALPPRPPPRPGTLSLISIGASPRLRPAPAP